MPIINSSNQTIAELVHAEIIAHCLSTACTNADVKSIKSVRGIDKLIMLNYQAVKKMNQKITNKR